ncbi:hypothetical protein IQ260_09115 [Leptolyngbya cf. ectocarpi LEGE 11479]|uniref:Uncharacterized protein n=1 Tax=Leptolyngbya cf. ectocarpi LEGE 11479 TaxID=1828722 RepID=A0A928X3S6_LEPEC|nr:hypothetical protein [Leptolyngbya ectocarpi]MBE9066811.1 hypothetical protein [Leptolyngbya cf. ectocarpi LEGE 11479]
MPQSNKGSRRRLLFLVATATIAGSTGIALGSALRFQVVPVGQAPLFKPQQDFPPSAKWPPPLPTTAEPERFDTNWGDQTSPSQLVYNDHLDGDAETYGLSAGDAFEGVSTPDSSAASLTTLDGEEQVQDSTRQTFENDILPDPTQSEELEHSAEAVDEVSLEEGPSSAADNTTPWANKQSVSEFQFSDGPIIITPEPSIPTSEEPLDSHH